MTRRVLCFEYATGGGAWEDPGLLAPGNPFLREGTLMWRALAADLTELAGVEPTFLWDARLPPPGDLRFEARLTSISSATQWRAALRGEVGKFDDVLFVAPECDGILERLTVGLVSAGLRLTCPSPALVRLASDKQTTAEVLQRAGVPVPLGRRLWSGDRLPSDASYPAVLKPVDGAGSHSIRVLDHCHALEFCPGHSAGWRFESLAPGRSASVLVARRSDETSVEPVAMPASWQMLSDDGRLRYLGGETPLSPSLDERARRLGLRVARALPAWRGFIGVDLILGDEASGAADVAIEVNPRVTTSYIGVRRVVRGNLLRPLFCDSADESDWWMAPEADRVDWEAH